MEISKASLSTVDVVGTSPLWHVPSGAEVVTVTVELPPNYAGGPAHRHPGPVYGYMIEGEMLFELEDEPPHIVRAGQHFAEPGGDKIHYLTKNLTDGIARFVAVMLVPSGQDLLSKVDETEIVERRHRRVSSD